MIVHLEAEMALIGSVVLSKSCARRLTQTIPSSMFGRKANQILWEAITEITRRNGECDYVSLTSALGEELTTDAAGDYINSILEFVPSPTNADFYAEEVRKAWAARELQRIGESVNLPGFDPLQALAETRKIAAMAENSQPVFGLWSDFIRDNNRADRGIPTGFSMLDKSSDCGGLKLGQTGIILAGTGSGKTWALLQMAKYASDEGYRALFATFSDLNAYDVADRLMKMACGYSSRTTADRKGDIETWNKTRDYVQSTDIVDVYDGSRRKGGSDILRFLDFVEERQSNPTTRYSVIFMDYAQKLTCDSVKIGNAYEMAEACAYHVREFAGQLSLPIWLGSQVSTGPYGRIITKGNRVWEGAQVCIGHNYISLSRKEFELDRVSPIGYQPPTDETN
jgi:replicative DNA helicase